MDAYQWVWSLSLFSPFSNISLSLFFLSLHQLNLWGKPFLLFWSVWYGTALSLSAFELPGLLRLFKRKYFFVYWSSFCFSHSFGLWMAIKNVKLTFLRLHVLLRCIRYTFVESLLLINKLVFFLVNANGYWPWIMRLFVQLL